MAFIPIAFLVLVLSPIPQKHVPSSHHTPEKSDSMIVPACGEPGAQLRRIGWGKFGIQFDVPIGEVEVFGGEPDVDYVRYVIKSKTGDEYLELWFGPMAMSPNPEKELTENSAPARKRDVVTATGKKIGADTSGQLRTGELWRHTFLGIAGMNGAVYKASTDAARLFDRIVNSACYVPSPGR